jgi:hypothetical protein
VYKSFISIDNPTVIMRISVGKANLQEKKNKEYNPEKLAQ